MPIFKCENPALKNVLRDLYNLIVEHGGYINDDVTVLEKDGELSILSSLPGDNKNKLIVIPESCLPRTENFMISANGDKLIAEPRTTDIGKSQISAMALMIEIYNLTNKLAKHRESAAWMILQNLPELMQKLFEARANTPKLIKYYEKFNNAKFDELLIDTFIGSKLLYYKSSDEEKASSCIMPFLDFVKHSSASPAYLKSADMPDALVLINSTPIPESHECFVRYGILDSLDSLLVYGFVDTSSPLVRSIPLQFDFHVYGRIQVDTQISQYFTGPLPDAVQDLRTFMPHLLRSERDSIQLSHLIIPGGNAPLALRRVLAHHIKTWKPGVGPAVLKDIVINLENFIINKNNEYYASLSHVLDTTDHRDLSTSFRQTLKTMIDFQSNKLHQYQVRMNKLDKC